MAVTKTIIKLSNTEAIVKIAGAVGDTATIILDSDLLLPLEYLNNDPIKVNIGAVYCTGVSGGYASLIRNNVTIMDVANSSLEPAHLLGEPFIPDSINNTSNILVNISGQQSQVYIYLKKVSGFTSTDTAVASPFNVLSLFGTGEQGAWYDPSDLTTLFQDSAGTTPVTAVEQPVGLMLDKSKGLAVSTTVAANAFGTSPWNTPASGTITSGVWSGMAQYSALTLSTALIVGRRYRVFGNGSTTGNTGIYSISGTYYGNFSASFDFYFVATNPVLLIQANTANLVISLSSFTITEIAGNHAFQGDMTTGAAAKRPMLSARVNLLTKTEDFSASPWSLLNPSGFATRLGNTVSFASGTLSQQDRFFQNISVVAGITYTALITVSGTGSVRLGILDGSGSITAISPVDITLTATPTTYPTSGVMINSGVNGGIQVQSKGTVASFTLSIADLRPTNSGALLPPYQRVNTASDYDTVGFPLYLKANGTSSAMSTNSIDFTATDKMTVVTGVRKIGDDTYRAIFEHSPPSSFTTESINFAAPTSTLKTYSFGTGGGSAIVGFYEGPITNVVSVSAARVIGGSTVNNITIKVNGASSAYNALAGSATMSGTPNFGNYPLYLFSRYGNSLYLNGQFYGAIIRGAQSDTASVTQTENYMAQKTGITF